MKRKLLIMASLFPPQKNGGGPAVSVMNIVKMIKDKFDIYIISKNYEINEKEPLAGVKSGWNVFDFGKVYYFDFGKHTIKNVFNLIKEINPDIIYQNSFFSYDDVIPILKYKKHIDYNVKIIIAPRGEFCKNRFLIGKFKKKVYLKFLKTIYSLKNVFWQATGSDEENDINNIIKSDKIYNVNNITILNKNNEIPIKEKGSLKLVFIARIHPTKNLLNAIKILKNIKGNIVFHIYGSIEDKEYWSKCLEEIKTLPDNIRVEYKNQISHSEVAKALTNYNFFYMPTIGENYGHSIVEAMLNGVPVIISDKTPWLTKNEDNCGFAIPLTDENKFADVIQKLVYMDMDEYVVMSNNAKRYIRKKLNIEEIINQYIEMFGE